MEHPPAVSQAQGSRMGQGGGQDTDAPSGELHWVKLNTAQGLFSRLVEWAWWSGKVARQHSSVCVVQEVKVQVITEMMNISCHLIQFCPGHHRKPVIIIPSTGNEAQRD